MADLLPQPLAFPALKSRIAGLPRAELPGHLTPGGSGGHNPEHAVQDLAMRVVRTPSCPLQRQQWSDPLPVRWSHRWQPGNGQRIRQIERRIRQGGHGQLPCTPSSMCLPGLPLVLPAPERPVQMKRELTALASYELQQSADLRDTVAHYAPLFAVALRATTRAA